eukprot:TRINITY_DN2397_c0_g2_i2.p1 TRINITY_DN2397_c0_g2~~TRINITY_DN2397_c0_g2_i2.p1  ORF type:complete len:355 (+),score=80.47 TRINITY_DN2397_c0_g2_i2:67-1065(+)
MYNSGGHRSDASAFPTHPQTQGSFGNVSGVNQFVTDNRPAPSPSPVYNSAGWPQQQGGFIGQTGVQQHVQHSNPSTTSQVVGHTMPSTTPVSVPLQSNHYGQNQVQPQTQYQETQQEIQRRMALQMQMLSQQQPQQHQQQQQQQQQQNQRQQEQQRQQQEEQKKLQQQRQEEQSSKRQKTEPNGTTQPTAQPAKAQPTGQPTQPQPQPQKSKPQQPAKPQVDPDSVDWIVSNFVLECEIKETEARIEELKKAGEEDEVLELEIRVQLLNLQSARIIELVNNGQLTMDVYVQMVKNRIEDEEKLAAQFTAKGQKSKAAAALKRASWMREEIGA